MKVTVVTVEQCFNTGNYENLRIRLEAQMQDSDTVESVVEALKEQIHIQGDETDKWVQIVERRSELNLLEKRVSEAREQWEQTRAFMAAQGLKTDAPDFPIAARKAITAASTTTTVEAADFK